MTVNKDISIKLFLSRAIVLLSFLFVLFISFHHSAHAGGATLKSDTDGPYFVEMNPLILPYFQKGSNQQIINLKFKLVVESLQSVDVVKINEPKLTDAYIERLYGAMASHGLVENGAVNVIKLKKEIFRTSNKILGDHMVKGVLIQAVTQRSL